MAKLELGPDNYAHRLILVQRLTASFLGRNGPFWADENYDRLVRDYRDYNELYRIVRYTLQNPVKAALCQRWQDWKYSYIKPNYDDFE